MPGVRPGGTDHDPPRIPPHRCSGRARPAAPTRPGRTTPRHDTGPGSAPTAAAGTLEATPDELAERLELLGREAGADAGTEASRRELAPARGRIAELEAARAADAATIAGLRAELEGSRAEARALREQLEAARQGLERPNAVLAAAAGNAADGGDGAARREAAADPGSDPPAPPPAGGPAAADGEPSYYAATDPVNPRAAPRNGAEVLALVGEGELVRRIGRDGGWLRVRYSNRFATDATGWVHGDFLRSAAPGADG